MLTFPLTAQRMQTEDLLSKGAVATGHSLVWEWGVWKGGNSQSLFVKIPLWVPLSLPGSANTCLIHVRFPSPYQLPSASLMSITTTPNILFGFSWRWYYSRWGFWPFWWVTQFFFFFWSVSHIHAICLLLNLHVNLFWDQPKEPSSTEKNFLFLHVLLGVCFYLDIWVLWLEYTDLFQCSVMAGMEISQLKSFLGGSNSKECACQCRRHKRLGLIPESGRSPGKGNGNPLQYSHLENPMDRGAWQATVHGVTKHRTWLSDRHFHF